MSTNQKFLKEKEVGISQHHKDFLGLDVPENYFANSKSKILAATIQKEAKVVKIEKKNHHLKIYSIAASIALLISISLWFFIILRIMIFLLIKIW
ncbi:MAG: hypothetical protein HC798_01055 [Polaribacter sp.]|nr:hypothetical protein [Polaribacter sp.]